jgi:DNA-binding beta-propeller fold protein YncE
MKRFFTFVSACMLGHQVHAVPVSFSKDLAPILLTKCQSCHGPKKAKGKYRVDTYARTISKGAGDHPGFTPRNLNESEVYYRLTTDDKDERMPSEGNPLSGEQIALFKRWIQEGSTFDGEQDASLASIIPPPVHPRSPEKYSSRIPIQALAYGADGNELFVGGYHEITVWNPKDGKLLRRIGNIGQRAYAIDLSPDGNFLAVACGSPGLYGEVRILDTASGKLLDVLARTPDVALDARFSPDGTKLATASTDGRIRIFHKLEQEWAILRVFVNHSDWVNAVAWSSDGKRLASASRDKTAKVFDLDSGKRVVTFSGHSGSVNGVAFHPDGNQVYSTSEDKLLALWKIGDGKKTKDIHRFGGSAHKILSRGESLFISSNDKIAYEYSLKEGRQMHQFTGHEDWPLSIAFDSLNKLVASSGFNGRIHIWSQSDAKAIHSFFALPGYELVEPTEISSEKIEGELKLQE